MSAIMFLSATNLFSIDGAGWVLLVRIINHASSSWSIHIDTPVHPVWPNDDAEKFPRHENGE